MTNGKAIQDLCDRARDRGELGGMVLEAWLLEAYNLGLADGSTVPEKQATYRDFCVRLNIARIAMNDAEIRKVLDEIDGHFHSMQGGH